MDERAKNLKTGILLGGTRKDPTDQGPTGESQCGKIFEETLDQPGRMQQLKTDENGISIGAVQ